MLSGIRAEIALKIYGDDLDTLRNLAETLRERIAPIPGLVDLQVEKQNRIPQLRIEVDHERAKLYGIARRRPHPCARGTCRTAAPSRRS